MDEQPELNPGEEAFSDDAAGPAGGGGDRLAALRAAVERGLEDIRAGQVVDLDAAFDRIESMLDEIEAAERP